MNFKYNKAKLELHKLRIVLLQFNYFERYIPFYSACVTSIWDQVRKLEDMLGKIWGDIQIKQMLRRSGEVLE